MLRADVSLASATARDTNKPSMLFTAAPKTVAAVNATTANSPALVTRVALAASPLSGEGLQSIKYSENDVSSALITRQRMIR